MNKILLSFSPCLAWQVLLTLVLVATTSTSNLVTAAAPPARVELTLVIGHAHVLEPGPIKRMAVGDGKIVQATSLDNGQILILPEKQGQSTLHLWPTRGAMQTYLLTVVASDAARSLAAVQAMLGSADNVNAQLIGQSILIEGRSLSADQHQRIRVIQERYPHVVNMASGLGAERMIAMDVRMIEIKKSALQKIGVRWTGNAQGPAFGVVGDFHRSNPLRAGSLADQAGIVARDAVSPFATAFGIATSVTSMLDFLVTNGDAVILAEPRLSCKSGGSARFVAGGELPIPQSSGLGAVSVAFKEYGVKFDFSPTAGADGIISAKIATEVSAIDFDVMVQDVPGLIKRRAETEVNLRENQTLVIAGLLTEDAARNVHKVAGLGDIPILGRLFRSRDFRSHKTDLVVFVTPRFVAEQDLPTSQAANRAASSARSLAERIRIVD